MPGDSPHGRCGRIGSPARRAWRRGDSASRGRRSIKRKSCKLHFLQNVRVQAGAGVALGRTEHLLDRRDRLAVVPASESMHPAPPCRKRLRASAVRPAVAALTGADLEGQAAVELPQRPRQQPLVGRTVVARGLLGRQRRLHRIDLAARPAGGCG